MTTPTRSVTTDHTLLALRQASTSIFFVLTVLEAALMVRLGWVMLKGACAISFFVVASSVLVVYIC